METPSSERDMHVSIPEHEILLSFNGDEDAALFDEWWNLEGLDAFMKWAEAQ